MERKVLKPGKAIVVVQKPSFAVQTPPTDDDPCFDILNVKRLTKMSLEQNMIDE